MHKGPLAYAEAFLEPTELNLKYSKEVKKKFKLIFKRLIELYNKGIELYGQLAICASSATRCAMLGAAGCRARRAVADGSRCCAN